MNTNTTQPSSLLGNTLEMTGRAFEALLKGLMAPVIGLAIILAIAFCALGISPAGAKEKVRMVITHPVGIIRLPGLEYSRKGDYGTRLPYQGEIVVSLSGGDEVHLWPVQKRERAVQLQIASPTSALWDLFDYSWTGPITIVPGQVGVIHPAWSSENYLRIHPTQDTAPGLYQVKLQTVIPDGLGGSLIARQYGLKIRVTK